MKVGVDIDGVLRNFHQSLVSNYKKDFPNSTVLPLSYWSKYDMKDYFINGMEIRDYFINYAPERVYGEAKPYPFAKNLIERLKDDKHSVHIVSYQPSKRIENITTAWLVKNGITGITLHYTKFREKHKIPLDIMLDDCSDVLRDFEMNTNTLPVVMDRTWNKDWTGLRIDDLPWFIKITNTYSKVKDLIKHKNGI